MLLVLIESLWSCCECTLNTTFRVDLEEEASEPFSLVLIDRIPENADSEIIDNKLNLVRIFLSNVRVIAALLMHVFNN